MLDIKYIRENIESVKKNSADRLATADIDTLIKKDEVWRMLQAEIQELRAQRNKGSKSKPTPEEIADMKVVGDKIAKLEERQLVLGLEIRELLLAVPNLTHPDVVVSDNEDDNPVLETVGKVPDFGFEPKDHVELGETLGLIDLERGTKVAGAKFYYLKDELAMLQMALVTYALNIICKKGYRLLNGPDIAKTDIIERLGYNPRGESTQVYRLEGEDLSLIGTSEITLGGYHAEEVLDASMLPLKYVSFSHCFRTEAGAYSKFSKGIFRVHQFDKVEMFAFCMPEDAEKIHLEMLSIEKDIFAGLKIPFRVVDHCTADLGNPAYRTYDLEAWMPGKPGKEGGVGDWAEITSTSNCTDYQSRGLNIRYQKPDGVKEFVYTLNGTGVAVGRALIAIMENYQEADGSITVPKALRDFVPFKKIVTRTK